MTELSRRSFLSVLVASPLLAKIPGVHLPPPAAPPAPALEHVGAVLSDREAVRRALLASGPRVRVTMMPLPFGPDPVFQYLISPGRIARFVTRPLVAYRPDRLIVSATREDLGRVELLGCSSAGEPQFDESIPAWIFDPSTFISGPRLEFATCAPGQEIVMCARNVSDQPAFFMPTFIGRTVRELTEEEAAAEDAAMLELDDELERDFEAGELDELDEEDLDE